MLMFLWVERMVLLMCIRLRWSWLGPLSICSQLLDPPGAGRSKLALVWMACLCSRSSLILQQSSPGLFPQEIGRFQERIEVYKAFWGLGLELTQHNFCCSLLAKASHKLLLRGAVKSYFSGAWIIVAFLQTIYHNLIQKIWIIMLFL